MPSQIIFVFNVVDTRHKISAEQKQDGVGWQLGLRRQHCTSKLEKMIILTSSDGGEEVSLITGTEITNNQSDKLTGN